MDKNALFKFCSCVRGALEDIPKTDHSHRSSFGCSKFPNGCCGDTSILLAYLLYQQFKVVPKVVQVNGNHNHVGGSSHSWILVDDTIIDLTADQFNEEYGFNNPAVMITSDTTFHDLFTEHKNLPDNRCRQPDPKFEKTVSEIKIRLTNQGWHFSF
ncbi:hypothetical protein [Providencia sp. PROV193]|uniref:hypothetical protein n=1 Tax=Providencia sp. PROV193 TaxID=2949894 RepID=UPI00234B536A|nr:hypothetical protein [Providencia sp. PROV193]